MILADTKEKEEVSKPTSRFGEFIKPAKRLECQLEHKTNFHSLVFLAP